MVAVADPGRVKILIAGPDLRPVLPPVTDWESIDWSVSLNEPGSSQFVAPARPELVQAVTTPGNRVHAYYDGRLWTSGPIEVPGAYSWSASGDDAGPGTVTVNFASNLVYLAWRLCYPDPSKDSTAQGTKLQYTASGNAETLMRDLVNANAGPGALAGRRIPHLVLGDVAGVGSTASTTTRFGVLTDVLRDLASAGGGLGFDVVMRDNVTTGEPELAFVVYAPPDLSGRIRYSRGLGNLNQVDTTPEAPTATVAIVGSDDTGGDTPDTTVVERVDSDGQSWGRMETWVASTASDPDTTEAAKLAQMQQDGDLALLGAKESVGTAVEVVDTEDQQYGVAYPLGAIVGVQLVSGVVVTDQVTAVKLSGNSGEALTEAPTIGNGNPKVGSANVKQMRDIERRVGRLERG